MGCDHEMCGSSVSRRNFMQAGTLALSGGPLLASASQAAMAAPPPTGAARPRTFAPDADYLGLAMGAADWMLSNQMSDEFGVLFPGDPADPKRFFMTSAAPESFYSGMAGTVLMFAELAQKTNEARYREAARDGAERLLKRWPAIADTPIVPIDMRWSMIFGVSGIGMALYLVGQMLSEPRYSAALGAIADRIVKAADPSNPKGTWTEYAGYIADSSTILYLLHAARLLNQPRYLRTARQAGDRLIALATQESDGTLAWRGPQNPTIPHLYYPNFEMGTSGIAYTLASLFEATGERRYLDAAKRAAGHLMNIAAVSGNAALIPYALPDHSDIFYLGFCHGAAGTARAFYKLHQQTGDRIYLDWTDRLAQGILATGAPELESPGMWNTMTQCCGVASHVTFFLGLWAAFGNARHLELAQRAGRVISSRASNLDGKGDRWFMAWSRVDPNIVNTETGYMIGASGIATALLHLHLANAGRYDVSLPFDNPFPAKRMV